MPFVNIHQHPFFFLREGRGAESLLLLPGLGTDSSCWIGCRRPWLADFNLLMPDLPGVGQTPAGEREMTLEGLADELALLLDELGVEQTHLLGHSMGGMLAQTFARRHPGRLRRLVLVSSMDHCTPFCRRVIESWCAMKRKGSTEDFFRCIFPWIVSRRYFSVPENYERALRFFLNYPLTQSAEDFERQAGSLFAFDGRRESSRIAAPTLLLGGSEDLLFPPAEQEEFRRRLSHARLHILEGIAHSPMLEPTPVFARTVREFLLQAPAG